MMRRILPVVLGLWPANAWAHATNTGFGPFYDGLAHVLVTPLDVLALVGMALLAASSAKATARITVVVLPLLWAVAAITPLQQLPTSGLDAASIVLVVGIGILVAVGRSMPRAVVVSLGVLVGLVRGASAAADTGSSSMLMQAGVLTGVFVLVTLLAGQVAVLQSRTTLIVVRVAGSWIAAIGLLLLGWAVRQPA